MIVKFDPRAARFGGVTYCVSGASVQTGLGLRIGDLTDAFGHSSDFFHQTVGYPESTIAFEIPRPYIRSRHEYNQKIGPLSDRK